MKTFSPKLFSELKSYNVKTFISDIVAGIIVLRAALTFLIHWEIKQEELAETQK